MLDLRLIGKNQAFNIKNLIDYNLALDPLNYLFLDLILKLILNRNEVHIQIDVCLVFQSLFFLLEFYLD